MEPAIKIKNLSVTLGGQIKALQNINLELPPNKIVGVIGPSGAGKTTLMRVLVGRLQIEKGSVDIFNLPAGSLKLRGELSYMTQALSVFPDLTVEENLSYFAVMIGKRRGEIGQAVDEVLDAVDLKDKKHSLVSDLSGGQKQRASLAVALLGTPKLMILDEPTVGLDPVLRDKLWGLFRKLASQGTSIIVSSHSMEEAERCDDLVLIRNGRVVAHDTPSKMRKSTGTNSIEQSFLKLVDNKE
jgi:ABC-2 type transport system ATP-binding protein